MTLYQTLTAIVTATYLALGSVGNVGAEEPKKTFTPITVEEAERLKKKYKKECPDGNSRCIFEKAVEAQVENSKPKPLSCEAQVKEYWAFYYKGKCIDSDKTVIKFVSPNVNQNQMYVLKKEKGNYGKIAVFTLDDSHKLSSALFIDDCIDLINCEPSAKNWITTCMGDLDHIGTFLDLSDPEIRKAAETKFCEYFTKTVTQYEKAQKAETEKKKQQQLDLLE